MRPIPIIATLHVKLLLLGSWVLHFVQVSQAAAIALPSNAGPSVLDTGIVAPAGASVRIAASGVVDSDQDCGGRGVVAPDAFLFGACTGSKYDPAATLPSAPVGGRRLN